VLPALACNHPVIRGAQGADVQSGLAWEVDVPTEVLVVSEVLVDAVIVPPELEVTLTVVLLEPMVALAVEEELVLLDSTVCEVEETFFPGLFMVSASASAPTITSAAMRTEITIRPFKML
jgi:hypothetical protein